MGTACGRNASIQGHPCFGGDRQANGRLHLPVAPRCNIKCNYCTRKHDCANESRPGVTSRLLTPQQALERVRDIMADPLFGPVMKVAGIAGPGDPLANETTFETFQLIGEAFPNLIKCLSTNGLRLPDTIDRLHALDLRTLTITINAIDPVVGAQIYAWVRYGGERRVGVEGSEILIHNQIEGLERAVRLGLTVKVNTVLIPGVNEAEIPRIAEQVKRRGAFVMNVMPLIPQAQFAHIEAPSRDRLEEVRRTSEQIIGQFRHCQQCRADAVGLIGGGCSTI